MDDILTGPDLRVRSNRRRARHDGPVWSDELELLLDCIGRVLATDNLRVVHDDIGPDASPIEHAGTLIVHGDLLPGAWVRATASVIVEGVIEGADVYAGRDVVAKGGISGARGRVVQAGGGVRAKFIRKADLAAMGTVFVEREISHSIVKTRGAVRMASGRLVGGETMALCGLVVKRLGTEKSVRTTIAPGHDFLLPRQLVEREAQLKELRDRLDGIQKALSGARPGTEPRPRERDPVRRLETEAAAIRMAIRAVQSMIKGIISLSRAEARPYILVMERAFAGTVVGGNGHDLPIAQALSGPVRIVRSGHHLLLQAVRPIPSRAEADP